MPARYPGIILPNPQAVTRPVPVDARYVSCPPKRYVARNPQNSIICDRAIIRYDTRYVDESVTLPAFFFKTFGGLTLHPIPPSDGWCGYEEFKDNDVVAIECEIISTPTARNTVPGTQIAAHNFRHIDTETIPYDTDIITVKLSTIRRVWTRLFRSAVGTVRQTTDSKNRAYHTLTQIVIPGAGDPYYALTHNRLETMPIQIIYHIMNIMDTDNLEQTLQHLSVSNCLVQINYIDNGDETPDRIGIPIVILNHQII